MDHYLDVRILPDPEFQTGVIMNALAEKLHRALATMKTENIGMSFPQITEESLGLGPVMRLHGAKQSLEDLMQTNWLLGISDYIRTVGPLPIPDNFRIATVRRKQIKSNSDRLRRRLAKRLADRERINFKEALNKVPEPAEKRLNIPFLQLSSRSTGHNFRLYIEQKEVDSDIIDGRFNSYGLSQTATVPLF